MKISYQIDQPLNLPAVAFLLADTYDHAPDPSVLSATKFNDSPVKWARKMHNAQENLHKPLTTLTSSRTGSAVHDGIERALKNPQIVKKALELMGKSISLADQPGYILTEKRDQIQYRGKTIRGKYDAVIGGHLVDYKTTSVATWTSQRNVEKFTRQASIYNLIFPEIIDNHFSILYIFRDWVAGRTAQENYPQSPMIAEEYPLWPEDYTRCFLDKWIDQANQYMNMPLEQLPECSPEDRWEQETTFKYYKTPGSARATKVLRTEEEYIAYLNKPGEIQIVQGKSIGCKYCELFENCEQAAKLNEQGLI